jgi:hypothetical protein
VIRKDPVTVFGPDCLRNSSLSCPCIWRIINPIRMLHTFRSTLVHLAAGPLSPIGNDQSRGCDIPTSACGAGSPDHRDFQTGVLRGESRREWVGLCCVTWRAIILRKLVRSTHPNQTRLQRAQFPQFFRSNLGEWPLEADLQLEFACRPSQV